MKNHYAYTIALMLLVFEIFAFYPSIAEKEQLYAVTEIPKELLENSYAVIREDITTMEVVSAGQANLYIKYAVTILDKRADHFAEVSVGYDKINKITSLQARTFDKSGMLITNLKSRDIKDYASFDGSIYSDNREKYFDLRHAEYPYTIEYEVQMLRNGILSFPGWVPYSGFNVSSQKSSLKITAPESYQIRYMEMNMEPMVKESKADGKTAVSWDFGSFLALEREPGMPSLQTIIPMVLTAPSAFEMEGYKGDMSQWQSFGQWEKLLNEGRDELPHDYAIKVKEVVANDTSRTEKIRKLYQFLQANTRYVSIQLGIGGWQTFPASDVAANGYGDCKALSNFMKSMLKVVGIESYYTLVKSGNTSNIVSAFPSNQFDHMILCVPNVQDTIWLECTSQDDPFGYLGQFTGDRDVLVINEEGGKIVHTANYTQENNRQINRAEVILNENGSANVQLSANCSGLQYDNFSDLLDIGESEQKKWLYKNLEIPSFQLSGFSIAQKELPIPELSADISVSIDHLAAVSGKRLFVQPNVFNKINSIAIPQKERRFDFEIKNMFMDTDSIKIIVPQGYHLEHVPEKTEIESSFGSYSTEVITGEGQVRYIRNFSLSGGTFPPAKYLEYVDFINKVSVADKSKLVLVKST